jgi:hypothetical protein
MRRSQVWTPPSASASETMSMSRCVIAEQLKINGTELQFVKRRLFMWPARNGSFYFDGRQVRSMATRGQIEG